VNRNEEERRDQHEADDERDRLRPEDRDGADPMGSASDDADERDGGTEAAHDLLGDDDVDADRPEGEEFWSALRAPARMRSMSRPRRRPRSRRPRRRTSRSCP
jgi:hypothetical protein